jgi:hypothetical protein
MNNGRDERCVVCEWKLCFRRYSLSYVGIRRMDEG